MHRRSREPLLLEQARVELLDLRRVELAERYGTELVGDVGHQLPVAYPCARTQRRLHAREPAGEKCRKRLAFVRGDDEQSAIAVPRGRRQQARHLLPSLAVERPASAVLQRQTRLLASVAALLDGAFVVAALGHARTLLSGHIVSRRVMPPSPRRRMTFNTFPPDCPADMALFYALRAAYSTAMYLTMEMATRGSQWLSAVCDDDDDDDDGPVASVS